MNISSHLKKQFLHHCLNNRFQQNDKQIKTLELLVNFNKKSISKNILLKLFSKLDQKIGFYLFGDVGVGKTMLLNFFFNQPTMNYEMSTKMCY